MAKENQEGEVKVLLTGAVFGFAWSAPKYREGCNRQLILEIGQPVKFMAVGHLANR